MTVDGKPAYVWFVSPTQINLQAPDDMSTGTVPVVAKAGDSVVLVGAGFGPTTQPVPAGQVYSGATATANPVKPRINDASVTPSFAGLSGAGLYQINLTAPAGLGTGDVPLVATVGGVQTQTGVAMSLQ